MEVCNRMDSGKCSRRRLHLTLSRPGLLLIALLPLGQPGAQTAPSAEATTSAGALEDFVTEVRSLSAHFDQELWGEGGELLETAAGEFSLKRPNRFLWHYETEPEQYIVADGTDLWMYDVELAQVTRAPLDELAAASPAMLLSGDTGVGDSFEIDRTYELDGVQWVRLLPKGGTGDFSSVLLGFEGGVPIAIEIVDGLDQTTRIEFSDVLVDPELDDRDFVFEAPAGVSVIGADR